MTRGRRVRLSQVCSEQRDTVRPGERPDLRYIGLESIEPNTGGFITEGLSKTPESPRAISFHFNQAHILYGKLRPYLNKVALPDFEGKCSTEIVPLRPSPEIDRAYLAYFLRSAQTVSHINAKTAGARMPRADMEFVLGLELDLLPLNEQRRIVDTLSRAEGIMRLQRQAAEKAHEIIPALFLDMFGDPATNPKGWSFVKLGDAISEFRYGTSVKGTGDGYPVLRIPNVIRGELDLAGLKFVSLSRSEFDRLRLAEADLLFVRTNGNPDYVGRCAAVEFAQLGKTSFEVNRFVYASYLIRGRPIPDKVNAVYLVNYLHTQFGRRELLRRARTSAGQYNINVEGLTSVPLVLPPLRLQQAFTERVNDIRGILTQRDMSQRSGDSLFQALLAQAFTS